MAASELIQDGEDVRPHVEVNVTTLSPPTPQHPRVANSKPAHLASSLSPTATADVRDGQKQPAGSKMSSLLKQNQLIQSLSHGLRKHCDYVKISVPEERAHRLPKEWWKTGVAFLYALFNLVFTTVVITVVHERVPDKSVSPPLPDKFFDYVDRVPWAFTVTEVNGLILVGLWLFQWLFLTHKYDRLDRAVRSHHTVTLTAPCSPQIHRGSPLFLPDRDSLHVPLHHHVHHHPASAGETHGLCPEAVRRLHRQDLEDSEADLRRR